MTRQFRVLVVDADTDTLTRTTSALQQADEFSVLTASDTDAALDRLDETTDSSIDCIVTEHRPPSVDAFALADVVRKDETTSVVFFTAHGDEQLAGDALAAGVDGYLPNTGTEDDYDRLRARVSDAVETRSRQTARADRFEHYRAIVETMLDGAHIIDETGERVYFNSRSSVVHDMDTDRLESDAPDVFVEMGIMSQSELDHYQTMTREILDGERETARVEMTLALPNDGERTVEVRLTRLDEDRLSGVVGTTRDITERVAAEQELAARNEQLTNLARFFSHDLRNPLNVATGYAELARQTGADEHFDRLDDALDRMDGLVDDVLTLTTQRSTNLDRTPLSLASLVRRAWETVETGDAALVVETDRTVHADEGLIRRLFENLFRNSVEHGSTGSRTQSDDSVEHGAPSTTVTVRDVGDGVAIDDDGDGFPEDHEGLLDLGVSGNGGTGLGLAIVAENANAHGWNVVLEESPNGGARGRLDFTEDDGVEALPPTNESSESVASR
ncbi:PAS domain S-box-containing protein [Halogranum rubrum]|uniref:histidine kinase n=1 Tax=Halogranum rubrum TaxID=553466 RepID=A0A1I4C4F5_9EURY|nr:histidine kinase dimerization/phospho-acceptor domain-containing protein [Halogranum rubrum]SFK75972.1 PAS domain S-box-containing protein [Halogranum rubrum]